MGANPKFDQVLSKMANIHDKKSEDYASAENRYSNFEFAARCAALFTDPLDQVFATLIGVKVARLGELRGKGKIPNHESIQDTQVDLANYAALWASYYETPQPASFQISSMTLGPKVSTRVLFNASAVDDGPWANKP